MNLTKLSVVMFAGAVAASAIVPAALAQEGSSSGSSATDADSTAVSSLPAARVRMDGQVRMRFAAAPGVPGEHGPRGDHGPRAGGLFEAVAGELGVTADELRTLLADGSTPLDVASARGLDATQFTADVTATVRSNIEQAVADGTITQEQADGVLSDLDSHVASFLSSTPPAHGPRESHGPKGGHVLDAAAGALGITADELRAQLEGGSTILDVATASGLDATAFTADVAAAVRADVEAKVASGEISQEQADQVLADLDAHVANALSSAGRIGGRGHDGDCDGAPAPAKSSTTQTGA